MTFRTTRDAYEEALQQPAVLHVVDISAEPEDRCIDVAVHSQVTAAVTILVNNVAQLL
jgi:hypothetical protein